MPTPTPELVDHGAYQHAVTRFREQGIALPTFAQLADPSTIPPDKAAAALSAAGVDRNARDPRNLWRVHWHNHGTDALPGWTPVPDYLVLPPALTGVEAPIVLLLGNRFPLVGAHKVLAAYACLAPQVVTGQFDPTWQRAVWPSTGNYARGGVAISRLMGCRGIAILPENMSRARFAWLDAWVEDPADIIRTPGSESNVKEIYDACDELAADPANVIFNQFSAYANHLMHYQATGRAAAQVFETVAAGRPGSRLAAFVAATGSAGTIAAGDYLKSAYGSLTVAVEALECPTMLYNGFGEHNIQGIGDKHIPLIHNVMATDAVAAVSDRSTDALDLLFNTEKGAAQLISAGVERDTVAALGSLGLSGLCNMLASIKLAKRLNLGPDDVIVTVATDSAALYGTERAARQAAEPDWDAAAIYDQHLRQVTDDHLQLLSDVDRNRIFNLGYFTWVEQRGLSLAEFEARRAQAFWKGLRELLAPWDEMIDEFNGRTGLQC
ncbi:MAG TPA: pyridoxal-phosphate dependent enzyme [Acidimicrobiales bacterium]|jgi:cysteine synthase|nr:pyridoxal-phosphate dependent enzyme [Acidimicrobiales bacterium]